jgi:uncharacterized protein
MILEGIVTTLSGPEMVNIAPMGPRLIFEAGTEYSPAPTVERFVLRPFQTAQTYRNLVEHGEGVLHVTDDVLLLAGAAIAPVGQLSPLPALRPAEQVRGLVLCDCCRYYEFRIIRIDSSRERAELEAVVVHSGRVRDFFGLNRAKHAVVEAAILATRLGLLPLDEIETEFRKLAILVEKTGGAREHEAFGLLERHVQQARKQMR